MIRRKNRFQGHHSVSRVRGFVLQGKYFSVRAAHNSLGDYRAAVVVSKKVASSAVSRNRIRRRVFELVRTQKRVSLVPIDLIFYAKSDEAVRLDHTVLAIEIVELTKNALAHTSKRPPATPARKSR